MATQTRKQQQLSLSTSEKEAQDQTLLLRTMLRHEELENLGLIFSPNIDAWELIGAGKGVDTSTILSHNDEQWDNLIKNIISEIDRTEKNKIPHYFL